MYGISQTNADTGTSKTDHSITKRSLTNLGALKQSSISNGERGKSVSKQILIGAGCFAMLSSSC